MVNRFFRKYGGVLFVGIIGILAVALVAYSVNSLQSVTGTDAVASPGWFNKHFTVNTPVPLCASSTQPEISLSWSTVDGAAGYVIFRTDGGIASSTQLLDFTTSTLYIDTHVSTSTSYSYRVQAAEPDGKGGTFSNESGLVQPTCDASVSALPTLDSNLAAATVESIAASWNASFNNFFKIKKTPVATVSKTTVVPKTTTTKTVTPPVVAVSTTPKTTSTTQTKTTTTTTVTTSAPVVVPIVPTLPVVIATTSAPKAGPTVSAGGAPIVPVPTTTPTIVPPAPAVVVPPPAPVSVPTPVPAVIPSASSLQWGAYVGDGSTALSSFESTVGKSVNILADFEGWDATFPSQFSSNVGSKGKTLLIYWEPSFGYDTINSGSEDSYIKQFAAGAKAYGYPIILVPFDEFNLNESDWGYGQNGNTAAKFVVAWKHIHDLFVAAGATNVKFGLAYNNVSIPASSDNSFAAYYPGASYVDYVGIDGFNFGDPWQSFDQVFDSAISSVEQFNKPIYIFSMGSVPGTQKAAWIAEMGVHIKTYANIAGWIWFNQNGGDGNWLVNSDAASLAAFKALLP